MKSSSSSSTYRDLRRWLVNISLVAHIGKRAEWKRNTNSSDCICRVSESSAEFNQIIISLSSLSLFCLMSLEFIAYFFFVHCALKEKKNIRLLFFYFIINSIKI